MSDLDPTGLLFQLDTASTLALFWYVLLFDLPRYTLGFLAIAASERLRGRRPSGDGYARPLVSVVLAGHNERTIIRRCVESLRQQTYDRLEIICVDDGSVDGMNRELRRLRDDRLIDAALSTSLRCGKSSACNLGISRASGEVVVVTDCDCTFDRDAILHLIAPFAESSVGAVAGNVGVRNAGASILATVQSLEYLLNISVGKRLLDMFGQVSCASGALAAFRRRALTEVGGLDVGPGEDLDLTLRLRNAGWKVRFAENAWCLTDAPPTPRAFVRQRLRWERDALRLRLRKHRGSLDTRNMSGSTGELLHQLEFALTHLGATLVFPMYLVWLLYNFGGGALTVLMVVTLVYAGLDVIAVACALAVVDRAGLVRLLPYLPLYGPFHAYVPARYSPGRLRAVVGIRWVAARSVRPHAGSEEGAFLLIRRLRQKHRIDRLPNEVRSRRSRLGRFVYIALLFGFFLWLTDLFIGPLLRLEADGLVVAEHVSVGVPFAAQVQEMKVTPGAQVNQGDVLARVSSVDLKVSIATLTARNAELSTKRADIQDRVRVAAAVLPIARDRADEADRALGRIRTVRDGGNVSIATWSQALSERFIANERVAELQAEAHSAETNLAAVNAALADATRALAGLNDAYGSGVVIAPSDGIVGLGTARPGDVLTIGQPLMLLYSPQRYVLAYLETGTLYSVSAGDEVKITNGFVQASGRVAEVLPVAEQLPEEFRKVFQPRGRSQVARITLAEGTSLPLFAKVRLSGIGWLSPGTFVRVWLERWFRPAVASGSVSRPALSG